MLYAISGDNKRICIVDSETLNLQKLSYEELYNMYRSGISVERIITWHISESKAIIDVFKDCHKYTGFCPESDYEDAEITVDETVFDGSLLPITVDLHFVNINMSSKDIIIQYGAPYFHIWYYGRYIRMFSAEVLGIYTEDGEVYVYRGYLNADSDYNMEVRNLKSIGYVRDCTRNEFLRFMLFN